MPFPSVERCIERPNAAASLTAGPEVPLTLLQAPLGFGKSATAALALRGRERSVCWYDARPWHREAFVEPLVEEVRALRPDFGRRTRGLAQTRPLGETSEFWGARLGETFANELRHIDEPLIVVVDDVHLLAEDASFTAFIASAARAMPVWVRFFMLSRVVPVMNLPDLVARGQARIIDAESLRFSLDEVLRLATMLKREIDPPHAKTLLEATEGWPAGISLALRSEFHAFSSVRSASLIGAYLADELLAHLDPSDLELLRATAAFETLDARLLKNEPGLENVRERLMELERRGAMVGALDHDRFRLHPLVRRTLVETLDENAERQAHARAARVYKSAGMMSAASFHIERSGDAALARSFLRENAGAALDAGNIKGISDLLEMLRKAADTEPQLTRYVEGLLGKARGDRRASELFSQAALYAEERGDRDLAFAAHAQRTELVLGTLAPIERANIDELLLQGAALGENAAAAAATLAGWAAAVEGDFGRALGYVAPLVARGEPRARFDAGILQAYAQTVLGAFSDAERTLDRLLHACEDGDHIVLHVLTLVWYARLALMWGRTRAAYDFASEAQRLRYGLDLRSEETALAFALTEAALHLGNAEVALHAADEAARQADAAWYARDAHRARTLGAIAHARAAFLRGDVSTAKVISQRGVHDGPAAQRAVAAVEAAFYLLLDEPLRSAGALEEAYGFLREAIPLDAADAIALATAEDLLAFLACADGRAVERVVVFGPFEALIECRRRLVSLDVAGLAVGNARRGVSSPDAFSAALDLFERDGPRFEARLARAYAERFIPIGAGAAAKAPSFGLTARELEITAFLVEGLTNKEIAQRLVVGARTVETHVEHVLGKLEVSSRSRAIAKAIRLGLATVEG